MASMDVPIYYYVIMPTIYIVNKLMLNLYSSVLQAIWIRSRGRKKYAIQCCKVYKIFFLIYVLQLKRKIVYIDQGW